jgi:hypothetical protein
MVSFSSIFYDFLSHFVYLFIYFFWHIFFAVIFAKVETDATPANQQLSREAAITAYPTFHTYFDMQRVGEMKGANPQGLEAQIIQSRYLMFNNYICVAAS